MRTCITNAVCGLKIVGQIAICVVRIKAELQHLHARISACIEHFYNVLCKKAQVLCDYLHVPKLFSHFFEKPHVRTFSPLALFGVLCTIWYAVIAFKAPEMVYSHHVIGVRSRLYTLYPPAEFISCYVFPVVKRIAPKLTVCRECVRWTSCHLNRLFLLVKAEILRCTPHLNTVICHIYGNIAYYFDALFVGISL